MCKNKKLSLVVLLVFGLLSLQGCSRKQEAAEPSFHRKTIGEEEDEWRQRKCQEAPKAAVEKVLKYKGSKRRDAVWSELSRKEIHCGALPEPHFTKFSSLLYGLRLKDMQQTLRRWLEKGQAKTLDQICPDGKKKLEESLKHPFRGGQTLHLMMLCPSFAQEWRIFKEVDPITFLAVQVILYHWKEKGILTEEHKNLLKLLLHDVAHEIAGD